MLILIAALFVVAAVCPLLIHRFGRKAFLPIAIAPAIGCGWVAWQASTVTSGGALRESVSWVPSVGMELDLRMGVLQWLMALIVLGIGAVVLAYCTWYFTDESASLPRFAGVLTAFIAAMLGLVLSDDLLVTYVFWELTTVFSFLLVGQDPTRRAARQAAIQALIVTTLGGLAMLVGALMLGKAAGTHQISAILSDPPSGTFVTVAILLLLVGAISKSAIFPFQFWLPAAMAAPTPVSAYLHAASMVKAGVFLVALLAPAFAMVPGWRPMLLILGLFTMLLGGWRALRQHDLKLLLAYGTVSQLGFMILVLGIGTFSSMIAGLAVVLGHALFKATLFLVVGIIDRSTGTRDLRRLSGLLYRMPSVAVASVLAAASMAGIPPLLGYVAKEGVYASLVELARTGDGTDLGGAPGWLLFIGVVLGSILTVAYSARFIWGAFATREVEDPIAIRQLPTGVAVGPIMLAALGLLFGFLGAPLTTLFGLEGDLFAPESYAPELSLWHGFGLPIAATAFALLCGGLLFVWRAPFGRLQERLSVPMSMERIYRWAMRQLDRIAVEVTGSFQRGSAGAYLAFILIVVIVLPGSALLRATDVKIKLWDSPWQAAAGLVIALAAVMAVRSRRRLRAVILAGATGYGTAALFVFHGAPDLALTQVLVETLSMVVCVLALRRLPEYFTDRPLQKQRYLRMALGFGVAVVVAGFLIMGAGSRLDPPVSASLGQLAKDYGGGLNIVNVILVDTRAWDTLGEISVLVAAATGVASLIFIDARGQGIRRVREIPYPTEVVKQPVKPGRRAWLAAPRTLPPDNRSIIFEVITRLIFHTIMIYSIYLLLAGHNAPGGGFAGGMVAGLALVIRYLAGGRYELDEAAPVDAGHVMGWGLTVAVTAAVLPMAFGEQVLQSAIWDIPIPLIGNLHVVTSALFDIGVYLVVVGLVLDLLRAFGSQVDRQILRTRRQDGPDDGHAGHAGHDQPDAAAPASSQEVTR